MPDNPTNLIASNLTISRVTPATSDEVLTRLAEQIDAAAWDDANDIDPGEYTADSLRRFIATPNSVLVVCYADEALAGIASAMLLDKPYADWKWLYIDEVDTCVNWRRRGVGRTIMNELLNIAKREGAKEAWLGTEPDNGAALALYRGIPAHEEEPVVGFEFDLTL